MRIGEGRCVGEMRVGEGRTSAGPSSPAAGEGDARVSGRGITPGRSGAQRRAACQRGASHRGGALRGRVR
jgi:hypothetical protein